MMGSSPTAASVRDVKRVGSFDMADPRDLKEAADAIRDVWRLAAIQRVPNVTGRDPYLHCTSCNKYNGAPSFLRNDEKLPESDCKHTLQIASDWAVFSRAT